MAGRSSEAYDFALFEPKHREGATPRKSSNVIKLPQKELEKNRRAKVGLGRILSIALPLVMMFGILGTFVYGQAQLTELTTSIEETEKTLQENQDIYKQLKIKSDSMLSLKTVENYASTNLGMEKTSQNQITTVKLSSGDKAQVVRSNETESWLDRLLETVRSYLS